MDQKADADLIRELYEMVTNLDVLQLSDGEKCTLALFGDIARRLAIANPSLDDPLQGDGVVLIDELELHMHTSWQRKVISMLKKTFPNIQFIITTHSPQILGEVDHDLMFMLYPGTDRIFRWYKQRGCLVWIPILFWKTKWKQIR